MSLPSSINTPLLTLRPALPIDNNYSTIDQSSPNVGGCFLSTYSLNQIRAIQTILIEYFILRNLSWLHEAKGICLNFFAELCLTATYWLDSKRGIVLSDGRCIRILFHSLACSCCVGHSPFVYPICQISVVRAYTSVFLFSEINMQSECNYLR